jgi:ubiquinone/menaquinone biosynthesis C-methylase UbiE
MAAPRPSSREILDVNRRYHDVAAGEYDAKWGISFGETGQRQVVGKLAKLLGERPGPFGRSLEIGAGTGYFSLNLLRAGVVREAVCTDISPGMLTALEANAGRLGLSVQTAACDAADLPFEDGSFDLVFGHAVLHHLPALDRAFAELHRVLRPGGTLFFAGEPSRQGDRIASVPKRLAWRISPLWRRAVGAPLAPHLNGAAPPPGDDHHLEAQVDVHAFVPADLEHGARDAGFRDVRVGGEELLANLFGWFNRTLEASADPKGIPMPWIRYAYHGYLLLQGVDRRLLEGRLPPQLFYNLMLAATKPES